MIVRVVTGTTKYKHSGFMAVEKCGCLLLIYVPSVPVRLIFHPSQRRVDIRGGVKTHFQ
jgi:hypothetical protein